MGAFGGKYFKTAVVFWGACLAVFALAFLFVIKPQMVKMGALDRQVKDLQRQDEAARLQTQESAKKDLAEQIASLQAQFARFVLPAKDDIQDLATVIINMSQQTGLSAFHIDPWSGEVAAFSEAKNVYGQSMNVTFDASFDEFAKFLNMLERYKSVIFIDTFSITRSNDESGRHKVEMNLAVLVAKPAAAASGRG